MSPSLETRKCADTSEGRSNLSKTYASLVTALNNVENSGSRASLPQHIATELYQLEVSLERVIELILEDYDE